MIAKPSVGGTGRTLVPPWSGSGVCDGHFDPSRVAARRSTIMARMVTPFLVPIMASPLASLADRAENGLDPLRRHVPGHYLMLLRDGSVRFLELFEMARQDVIAGKVRQVVRRHAEVMREAGDDHVDSVPGGGIPEDDGLPLAVLEDRALRHIVPPGRDAVSHVLGARGEVELSGCVRRQLRAIGVVREGEMSATVLVRVLPEQVLAKLADLRLSVDDLRQVRNVLEPVASFDGRRLAVDLEGDLPRDLVDRELRAVGLLDDVHG